MGHEFILKSICLMSITNHLELKILYICLTRMLENEIANF